MMTNKILRLQDLMDLTGLSRSTLYLLIADGLWVKPIRISQGSNGWPEHEVNELINARIAGLSWDETYLIVRNLEIARRKAFQWGKS